LVRFASQGYALAFPSTTRDVKLEDILRFDDLVAFTLFASVLLRNNLTRSLAVAAGYRFLRDEAGADLAKYCFCTYKIVSICYGVC
jgi:hypothetical protein